MTPQTKKAFEGIIETHPAYKYGRGKDWIFAFMSAAYNMAIDDAAEAVQLKQRGPAKITSIDKQSILDLKIL